jgi:hypothetical protein
MAPFITTIPIKDSFAEYTDQFIGKKISEILPAAANVAFRQSGKQLKKLSAGHQYTVEKNNELRWFELSIAPMKETDEHDTILFAFLILQKSNLLISHCRKVRRGIEDY